MSASRPRSRGRGDPPRPGDGDPLEPAGDAGGEELASTDDEDGVPVDAGDLPPVEVADRQSSLPIDPGEVIDLVRYALAVEGACGSVEVAFVDDAMIADLHERFLGVAGPTDVITFPHDDLPGEDGYASLGEIVVSTDTALRQCPEYGNDPVAEAYLYVVHGILHLLGWDDGEDGAAERMAARQREILEEWLESSAGESD